MEDIKKHILEVYEKGHVMSLGTLDAGGVWVADVGYVFDDELNLYWQSEVEVRHSKAIWEEPKVAATITVSGPNEKSHGVQISGVAEKIEGGNMELQKKFAKKKGKPIPIDLDPMTGTRSWYVLKPKMIELIHVELLGLGNKEAYDLL
jgi:uncharacterized protein YhbP (UPF0306 family)